MKSTSRFVTVVRRFGIASLLLCVIYVTYKIDRILTRPDVVLRTIGHKLSRAERIHLKLGQSNAVFVRPEKSSDTGSNSRHWELAAIQDNPVSDTRVNHLALEKFLDLLPAAEPVLVLDRAPTGFVASVKIYSENPSVQIECSTETNTILCNMRGHWIQARSSLPAYLAYLESQFGSALAGFRDLRISTFERDDIEDFSISAGCTNPFTLSRDGDQWTFSGVQKYKPHDVELWLENLFRSRSNDVRDDVPGIAGTGTAPAPICAIKLLGRNGRSELIEFFASESDSSGDVWVKNSNLPGIYKAPRAWVEALWPQK